MPVGRRAQEFSLRNMTGLFHFRRTAFSAQLKTKVGITLTKAEDLRVNLKGVYLQNKLRDYKGLAEWQHGSKAVTGSESIWRCYTELNTIILDMEPKRDYFIRVSTCLDMLSLSILLSLRKYPEIIALI